MTVVKHAKLTDRDIALKLIGGLARDVPRDPVGAIRDAHFKAIRQFEELANVFCGQKAAGPQWRAADVTTPFRSGSAW